jgi:uncharacterized protein YfeS
VAKRGKHPIEALVKLQRERVEGAARALGEATRQAEGAARAREASQQASSALAGAQAEATGKVRRALEGGGLRAADLAQQASWEQGARLERDRAENRVRAAEQQEREAQGRVTESRQVLVGARAQAEAAARVVDRAKKQAAAGELARADEEAEEVAQARRWSAELTARRGASRC